MIEERFWAKVAKAGPAMVLVSSLGVEGRNSRMVNMTLTLPVPVAPEGWQYGVLMEGPDGKLRVWGCGHGPDGRARMRMRLRYKHCIGPCLLPGIWQVT